ncbi:hypothetical protein PIB30_100711 [Stylosanthes scabra]|uniref:Uncharacterized protein n=1 Tax=Stylosanthes scabra TaxID=79078 RepID=A0ABU6RXW0_9FABA|nr:hypothetical protein [Stylosanthes scabra]
MGFGYRSEAHMGRCILDLSKHSSFSSPYQKFNFRTFTLAPLQAPKDLLMITHAKFGAEVAKESARNEKIAKKSLKAKSRAYAYAPKEPMRTHCHALGVTS